ncbi:MULTISPECIES: hypothetical protein [Vibrio]|uniref:hypothetical protein n=1 Tax=Vibrio TaxID=662 RepID=UPI0022B3C31C|nr:MULTISPECIES: hypothetical protein [Vibrio]MCZ5870206.1 hypothetical protein [Vibrio parahaemolyticus]MCZ5900522.1 hypothetical protein [Vibrio parahaemolyticus]MCZ6308846.1 hypothetical protein [Vibrio parahaemolyticus]MDW2149441.1 hypothetical protein [Vibrio sp. 378]
MNDDTDSVCEICGEAKDDVELCFDPYVQATSFDPEAYERQVYLCGDCYQKQKERS